jgi:nucleoside diphosphate kinase
LWQLAQRLGIDVPITLEDLDAYLDSQGWRPPHDMLVRLSRRNRWVRSLLSHPTEHRTAEDRLAVFLIREEALRRGGVGRAARLIEEQGFRILATRSFDQRTATTIARSVRGGNWGRGPWPISGGPPVAAVIVYDPAPLAVTRAQRRRFPFLANGRLLCKEQIRDAFNDGVPEEQHCNVVHSSDNGREALDYLRIVAPDVVETVLTAIEPVRPIPQRPAA